MEKKIEITGVTLPTESTYADNAVQSFTALVPAAAGLLGSANERLLLQFLPAIKTAAETVRLLSTATEGMDYENPDHVAAVKKLIGRAGIGQKARALITEIHKDSKAEYLSISQQIDKIKIVLMDPVVDGEKALDDFCLRGEREKTETAAMIHHIRYAEIEPFFNLATTSYSEYFPNGFGYMTTEQFQTYLAGAKAKHAERALIAERARLQAEQELLARQNIAALRAKRDAEFRPIARFFEVTSDDLLAVSETDWDNYLFAKQQGAELFLGIEQEQERKRAVANKLEAIRLQAESARIKAESARIAKEAEAAYKIANDAAVAAKKLVDDALAKEAALAKGSDKEKIAALIKLLENFMIPLNPAKGSVYGQMSSPEGQALFNIFYAAQRNAWIEMKNFIE